jgi:hypothetical protein
VPHRAVPSFTVEIKRARKPSVHTLTREVAAPDWDAQHRLKMLPFEDLFAATKPPSRLPMSSEATHDGPQARVRRLLPSLASMNSLQVREQQDKQERPARKRMAQKIGGRVTTGAASDGEMAPGEGLGSSSITAEFVPPTPPVPEAHVMSSYSADLPSDHVGQQRDKKGKVYGAAYRRAVRRGRPVPPLPPGERWKRRLPPVCR